ncbi:11-beta-hydroxysteroid dehydrogenase [Quillaja saponaria]|uniref:11-beta-hydroxysteroid dehydrogenase n=1 Tax=Quillaja saponaria TaxID=32244 RepID=A0AAD7LFU9_QUISA|nr:11-beta-hydroxysteroid dehydrogenase [Quillaja saponaria]
MDLIHYLLNIFLLPLTCTALLFILPPYFIINFLSYMKRSKYPANVTGKVVLITGASSGIGEYLAYEYARRRARLALVARREDRLREVADKARNLGSPDVIVIRADVSKLEDCKRFVDETVNQFGQLDHLVNNAGVIQVKMFEEYTPQFSDLAPIMDINFWGSVYATHAAVPHLRKSRGKIVAIASVAAHIPAPRLSFYNASKAAVVSFFETLRAEFGSDIGITIVCPGVIKSEMTSQGQFLSQIQQQAVPVEPTQDCTKAIVDSACRGDSYLTEPSWMRVGFLLKVLSMDFINKIMNIIVPPVGLITLVFLLPPYLFFKFFLFTIRLIFSENVAGKVILITGVSSGIGEHLAYEYDKRGACLALVARRENRLREVARRAKFMGSPDVIIIRADVSRAEDCKRFVDLTVNHFGRLDHLVNNAGIPPVSMFEKATDITNFIPAIDINFWGSAYGTYFAIPHLRESRGKIIGMTSAAGWLPTPRMSFYNASKAATISFYETLRTELGRDIGITIVTPGLIVSEMTQGKFLSQEGKLQLDQELRDVQISLMPIMSVKEASKATLNGACRGDQYLTEPAWIRATFYWKAFWPEALEWCNRLPLIPRPGNSETDTISKKLLDLAGFKQYLYPESVRYPEHNVIEK